MDMIKDRTEAQLANMTAEELKDLCQEMRIPYPGTKAHVAKALQDTQPNNEDNRDSGGEDGEEEDGSPAAGAAGADMGVDRTPPWAWAVK